MTETQFAMVSDWMENGNVNEFVKKYPHANRLQLVGVRSHIFFTSNSLIAGKLTQLADVAKGLIYIHNQGMIHGDLKGVRFDTWRLFPNSLP